MKIYLFALGLLACSIPTHADTLAPVSVMAMFGNAAGSGETFASSLQFDRDTQTIVPGSIFTASSGALGTFVFNTFTITSLTSLPQLDGTFLFPTTPVPEPSALLLLASGLIGLAFLLRRKLFTGAHRGRSGD